MTSAIIKPGTFVQYTHLGASGVGKVKETDDSPLVIFWDGKVEKKEASLLKSLANSGPVALLWDQPKELAPWAMEKPLKLVALALSIDGGKGKSSSIKEKLDGRVPLGTDWKTWWSKRAKSLNELSRLPEPKHFKKSDKGSEYALLCSIEEVPDDAKPPSSLAGWGKWLLSDDDLPTFRKNPSKVLSESLAEWPEDTIERALSRTLWGAELLLDSLKSPSAAVALAWMDAVGSAVWRWCALYPDRQQLAGRSGDVLSRLSQYIQIKEKRKESTLFRAGVLSEGPDRQLQLEQQRQEQERQRADYENRLEQQRQEQERQRTHYEERLEQQRQEQERQRASHAAEVEELRHSHAGALAREWREQERLRQQVRDLDAELAAKRELSRLEIRRDMLLAVGEVLQSVRRRNSPEEIIGDVVAGLRLAVRAGGAELLDMAPEGYDPRLHQTSEKIPDSSPVKVVAPGVIVRGRTHGDLVLLKALVKHEAG